MSNYISAEITKEKVEELLSSLDSVKKGLPFLLQLDPSVKRTMPTMDDNRAPFVTKCLQYASKDENIVPPYVDLVELDKDIALFNNLQNLSREVNRLAEMINDTRIAAGSDAYVASLSIYNSVKHASKMNVPGTQAILNDLKKAFDGQGIIKESAK
jgi:hypothetical protein